MDRYFEEDGVTKASASASASAQRPGGSDREDEPMLLAPQDSDVDVDLDVDPEADRERGLSPSGAASLSRTERRRRWARSAAKVAAAAATGLLAAVALSEALAAMTPARRQSLADAVTFWSVRRHPDDWEALRKEDDPKEDIVTSLECVLDSSVGTLYLARAGLEVHAAEDSCERYRRNSKDKPEAYMELAKTVMRKESGRRLSSIFPSPPHQLRNGKPSQVDLLIEKSKAQLAEAQKFVRDNNVVPQGRRKAGAADESEGHLNEAWDHIKEVHEAKENLTDTQIKALGYQRLCAADNAGAFSSFSYVAAYFSAMISECQSMLLPDAYCASDITRLLAATAEMTAGAAAISVQCTYVQDTIQADQDELERRLQERSSSSLADDIAGAGHNASSLRRAKAEGREMGLVQARHSKTRKQPALPPPRSRKHSHPGGRGSSEEEEEEEEEPDTITVKEMFERATDKYKERQFEKKARQEEQAACAVDVLQATGLMIRLGAEISGAHHHCMAARELGLAREEVCMGAIAAIFASLCLVTMMVSNSVDECPEEAHAQAICASAIAQLVGSIGEVASAGFLIADSCINYMGQIPISEVSAIQAPQNA